MTKIGITSLRILLDHVTLLLLALPIIVCSEVTWDYVIVGAGPAGLQMGYFLHQANRNYVILERSNTSGSFFHTYPRHDKLISINKRNTGKSNKEFNLRHDWNSLLSADEKLLFRHFSRDFFPHKMEMREYLEAYEARWALNVKYGTDIVDISREQDSRGNYGATFILRDGTGGVTQARRVLLATGIWKPNIPAISGLELAEGYETISTDPRTYEGKSVLILGHGNAAFETADAIYGSANVVHVLGRSRVRLSWETHYVGDVRGVNNALLDTYQLKSLDGVVEGRLDEINLHKQGDQIIIRMNNITTNDNFALRNKYDMAIRCLGFKFDTSIFNKSMDVELFRGKFPRISADYEVVGVPGMYVMGVAAHSLDYRRSAGGFVHGFRYTVRALHQLLEQRYSGSPWPSEVRPISQLLPSVVKRLNEASGIYQMYSELGDIIVLLNNNTEFRLVKEFPLSLLPEFSAVTGHSLGPHIAMVLEYGHNFSGPGHDVFSETRATGFAHRAHKSNFLHPVFYYYQGAITESEYKRRPRKWTLPTPQRLHHVVEDFLTEWSRDQTHVLPLRRFLESCAARSLRTYFSEDCFQMQLLQQTVPAQCQEYLQGAGLTTDFASSVTLNMAAA